MSRRETMAGERWRVQLLRADGTVQSEAMFRSEEAARKWHRGFMAAIAERTAPNGVASSRIQVRWPGESRYVDPDGLAHKRVPM